MKFFLKVFFLLVFSVSSLSLYAQSKPDRVQLINGGDYMEGSERRGEKYMKLIGSPKNQVVFQQKTTTIYGDSVYQFKTKNIIEVYGNVKIVDNEHITITGKKLIYDGNIKLAQMRENVVYKDTTMTLYTNFLDYDMPANLAYYQDNGKIIDSVNVLTSKSGFFNTITKLAHFRKNVKLVNPDYTLTSDTLQYNTYSKIAYTKGPTKIVYKDGTIINSYQDSEYRTTEEKSTLGKGVIETPSYFLKGDKLFFDDLNKFYSASKNVEMISKKDDVIITGDQARYWKDKGLTKVYGDPLMKKLVSADTFFLAADTLISLESLDGKDKKMLAFNNVKIFKSDLQGRADSASYHVTDSIIYLFNDPVLWTKGNQMLADSIHITLDNNKIDKMFLNSNSFMISQDTIMNFNQIKGRKMTAFFRDNDLVKIEVRGNGQSIYHALENDTITMGMNKIICSDMILRFINNQLNSISSYTNPEASFIPPHELTPEVRKLEGFNWRKEERPTKADVIGKHKPATKEELLPRQKPSDIRIEEREIKPVSKAEAKKSPVPRGGKAQVKKTE